MTVFEDVKKTVEKTTKKKREELKEAADLDEVLLLDLPSYVQEEHRFLAGQYQAYREVEILLGFLENHLEEADSE